MVGSPSSFVLSLLGSLLRFTPVFRAKGEPSLAGDRQGVKDGPAVSNNMALRPGVRTSRHYGLRLASRLRYTRFLLTMPLPPEQRRRARDGRRTPDGVRQLRLDQRVGRRGVG